MQNIGKKVLFIEPSGCPANVFTKSMTIPLLGPVYLATIAKREGYCVSIVNENISKRSVTNKELGDADILCLSCITATIERGLEIAKLAKVIKKTLNKQSRIILGGIHASMLPQEHYENIDTIVVGEAENIFSDILSGVKTGRIVYGEKIENLDSIPSPDFSIIENFERIKTWPIMTSRGCPYKCNFCTVTKMFGNTYRTQSIEKIVDEIFRFKKGWIFFVDDHFTAIPSRTNKLLDIMLRYNFSLPWTAQVRIETARQENLVAKMAKAGCVIVYIGIESINPKSLIDLNKQQTIEEIERSISVFQKFGIQVHGMFIIGNDSDKDTIFSSTIDFSIKNKLNYAQYCILTPLPGSDIFNSFEESNRLLHKNWRYYDGLHVVHKPLTMSAHKLQKGMIDCYRNFYSIMHALYNSFNLLKNSTTNFKNNSIPIHLRFKYMHPSILRYKGSSLLDYWIKQNQKYLQYLENITM